MKHLTIEALTGGEVFYFCS